MTIGRRLVLGATLAAGAASQTPVSRAAQPASGQQAPGFYRYRIGDIELTAINDGEAPRSLDGFVRNAALADVKQALRDAHLPDDKLTFAFTTLVVNVGGRIVLLDAGNGDLGVATSGSWMRNFRAAGFDPANVDQVVISHFHSDHINGLRLRNGASVFTRAELHVPAPEWDYWMDDGRMAGAPDGLKPTFSNVRRVFGPAAGEVRRFDWGREVAPGVTAIEAPGHTPGHTAFAIASGSARLIAISDTTNHPALFVRNPDWAAVYDMDADQARATRRRLLDMAVADRLQVAFYHAPFPATGHISRDGAGFRLIPVEWRPTV